MERNAVAVSEPFDPEVLDARVLPGAGRRLADAFRTLMKEKAFGSITTAEIAKTANANESLIFRYFQDKRGLLHHVLAEYTRHYQSALIRELEGLQGFVEKLRGLIRVTIQYYNDDLVFAKILLLEVRNYPSYFESDAYRLVRNFAHILHQLIESGKASGVVRADLATSVIRDVILGGIEHAILPCVVFGREMDTEEMTNQICAVVLKGIL